MRAKPQEQAGQATVSHLGRSEPSNRRACVSARLAAGGLGRRAAGWRTRSALLQRRLEVVGGGARHGGTGSRCSRILVQLAAIPAQKRASAPGPARSSRGPAARAAAAVRAGTWRLGLGGVRVLHSWRNRSLCSQVRTRAPAPALPPPATAPGALGLFARAGASARAATNPARLRSQRPENAAAGPSQRFASHSASRAGSARAQRRMGGMAEPQSGGKAEPQSGPGARERTSSDVDA